MWILLRKSWPLGRWVMTWRLKRVGVELSNCRKHDWGQVTPKTYALRMGSEAGKTRGRQG
jgi:hypothetical protein